MSFAHNVCNFWPNIIIYNYEIKLKVCFFKIKKLGKRMGQNVDKKIAYKRLELLVKRFKNKLKNGEISGAHSKTLENYSATEMGKGYSESQVRQGFILPMFRDVLGWDIDDSINEVIPELHNHQGIADFVFLRNNHKKFVLETKKTSINIDPNTSTGRDGIRQALGYARSLKDVCLALVSNFEILVFAHSYYMPMRGEENKNVLDWFHFSEFLLQDKFEIIWQFRFEACSEKNFLPNLLGKIDQKIIKKHKPIDDNLLDDLKVIRVKFANNIKGKKIDSEGADYISQNIINKIIFIRVLEDRGIISSRLADLIDTQNIWKKFIKYIYQVYKSFPIEFLNTNKIKYFDLNQLSISDSVLSELLQMFYDRGDSYYHDCYDFKYIPSDILGYAYEHSIAFDLIIESNKFILEKKKIYKDGVHYTPAYITKNLSKKTICRSAKDKNVSSVKELICADIACGSGSFLTSLYDCLYVERFNEILDAGGDFELSNGTKVLPLEERKKILEYSIYGIDIDYFATEISKLCLYLKYFESFPSNKKNLSNNEVPFLEDNIVFADSLIDTTMKRKFTHPYRPITSHHKKMMELITKKGFDVIVGNPPYIKIQDLLKIKNFPVDMYKEIYRESLGDGQVEFSTAFVERASLLLSPSGNAGFILPNKIFKNKQGEGLRGFLCKDTSPSLCEFVDFNSVQVFDASIYTCLVHLSRNKLNKDFKCNQIYRTSDLAYLLSKIENISYKYPSNDYEVGFLSCNKITKKPWNLLIGLKRKIIEKLTLKFDDLKSFVPEGKIFQGIPTGSDKIFLMKKIGEVDDLKWKMTSDSLKIINDYLKVELENEYPSVNIEKKYLKHVYHGSTDLKHFSKTNSDYYLLYPYDNEGQLLFDENFIESDAFKYLNIDFHRNGIVDRKGKTILQGLDKRENGKFSGKKFYQFSRPQNLELWSREKIMFPYMADHFNAHLCDNNIFVNVSTGGYAIIPPNKEFQKISLLAVMNSEIFNFLVKSFAGDFRGEWFECSNQYISKIPIPAKNFVENGIEDIRETIENLYKLNIERSLNPLRELEALIEFNAELDWLNSYVAEKYELTTDEMDVVDFYSGGESDLEGIQRINKIANLVRDLENKLDKDLLTLVG